MLRIPQSSSITGTSPSDCSRTLIEGGVLPFCSGAVSVFYNPKWLGRKIQEIYFSVIAFFMNTNKRNTNSNKFFFFKYSIHWITIPVLYHRSWSTKRKKKLVRRKIFFAAWYQMIWGLGFGDNCCNPLRVNEQNFRFLSILCDWLKSWNSISQRNGKLTKETFTALHHTTYAFL